MEKISELKDQWKNIYQKYFSMALELNEILIPEKPTKGDWCLLIVAQGLTISKAYAAMEKIMPCEKYDLPGDLDELFDGNARNTENGTYAVWFKNDVNPTECVNKSACEADPKVIGITLIERILYGIYNFVKTGTQIEDSVSCLCSGSVSSVKNKIPCIRYDSSHNLVRLTWFYNVNFGPDLGFRFPGLATTGY